MFYLRHCEVTAGDGIRTADSGSRAKPGRYNSQKSEMLMYGEDGYDLDMKCLWDSGFT